MVNAFPYELTVLLVFPIVMMPITYILGKRKEGASRLIAIIVSLIELALATHLALVYLTLPPNANNVFDIRIYEKYAWFPEAGITYYVALDGLSVVMVLLATILSLAAVLSSNHIEKQKDFYYTLFLLLEASLIGVFISFDLFLFYIFWELVLVPMYFLIAIWGGPRRKYAAIKFFIYTHVGSVLLLVSFFYIYWVSTLHTFSIDALIMAGVETKIKGEVMIFGLKMTMPIFLAILLFIGFGIKIPIFPFHTWLPDAHVEAPSPISIILAGVLLKMGGYGILRIAIPLLPGAFKQLAGPIIAIGLINIFYAGFVAMWQQDIKRLIAYSSISHMGVVVVGSVVGVAVGVFGAIYMMFAHGLVNGMLFLLSGVYKHHVHSRLIPDIKGLTHKMPLTSAFLVFGAFAGLGLPGLAIFIGEFSVILGLFKAWGIQFMYIVFGAVINAAYLLWMVQRVVFGPQREDVEVSDLCTPELIALTILAILILVLGWYPPMLGKYTTGFSELIASFFS